MGGAFRTGRVAPNCECVHWTPCVVCRCINASRPCCTASTDCFPRCPREELGFDPWCTGIHPRARTTGQHVVMRTLVGRARTVALDRAPDIADIADDMPLHNCNGDTQRAAVAGAVILHSRAVGDRERAAGRHRPRPGPQGTSILSLSSPGLTAWAHPKPAVLFYCWACAVCGGWPHTAFAQGFRWEADAPSCIEQPLCTITLHIPVCFPHPHPSHRGLVKGLVGTELRYGRLRC
jgi:hypothetical protein